MVVVTIKGKTEEESADFYIDERLKANLDKNAKYVLEKNDRDLFLCVDGEEGSGKSTLALQIGKYVDPTLNLSRIVFDGIAFRDAVFKAKKGQCIIFDEAFSGLSSWASLSAMNRVLVCLLKQMRQKNLFVIVVLPTFFLLDRYAAIFRSKALIHVYESGGRRGYFRVYNKKLKKLLYLTGKKDYSYGHKKVRTPFSGRFYGKFALGTPEMEKRYRNKKQKALENTSADPMSSAQIKYREQRDIIVYCFRKITKLTYEEMANYFDEYDLNLSFQQLAKICQKFGDSGDNRRNDEAKEEKQASD